MMPTSEIKPLHTTRLRASMFAMVEATAEGPDAEIAIRIARDTLTGRPPTNAEIFTPEEAAALEEEFGGELPMNLCVVRRTSLAATKGRHERESRGGTA